MSIFNEQSTREKIEQLLQMVDINHTDETVTKLLQYAQTVALQDMLELADISTKDPDALEKLAKKEIDPAELAAEVQAGLSESERADIVLAAVKRTLLAFTNGATKDNLELKQKMMTFVEEIQLSDVALLD